MQIEQLEAKARPKNEMQERTTNDAGTGNQPIEGNDEIGEGRTRETVG